MGLNIQKGNMYTFITHTWNVVKGACSHNCSYCYMKRWKHLKEVRFDKKEMKTDLGVGNFIFVGSSTDLFAENIPTVWIQSVIEHCLKYDKNKYLFQTKNPARFIEFDLPHNFILGTTVETNRVYPEMGNTPTPHDRLMALLKITKNKLFVTIEPIIDFDLIDFAAMLNIVKPEWINIGADSCGHNLPEPSKDKIQKLIKAVNSQITIKRNMKRIAR